MTIKSMAKVKLKLYITGWTPKSERAISNLRRICDEQLAGRCQMQVIDVLDTPQLAEDDGILATPSLIKELPLPIRRIIGDLSDSEKVLSGLEIMPYDSSGNNGNGNKDKQ